VIQRRLYLYIVAGASLASGLVVPAVHAAGGDVLKVGLVGCGNRGTGAAMQALRADKNTRLVALGAVAPGSVPDHGLVVLQDPEGNELCLMQGE